jgi:hypothetical protein
MKCPKCGYVSFDYNLSCPKCNKDISAEQEKLHIPSFRPDAPYLLGSLIGEADESQTTPLSTGSQVSPEEEADITLDEASPIDSSELNMASGELSLDDTSGLSLDTGETEAPAKALQKPKAEKAKPGTGEFKLEPETDLADLDLEEAGGDDFSLDSGKKAEEAAPAEEEEESDLDITLDLEGEEAPGSKAGANRPTPVGAQAGAPELEPLDLETEESQGKEELELSLDDLKVGDTGELKLVSKPKASGELDGLLEMDEIKLDEIPLTEIPQPSKRKPRVVSVAPQKKKAAEEPAEDELSLDLEDLDLDLELEEEVKPER